MAEEAREGGEDDDEGGRGRGLLRVDAQPDEHRVDEVPAAEYGAEACSNIKDVRASLQKLKAASAPYELRIRQALETIKELEDKRDAIPSRVPIQQLTDGDVIKLAVERKHLTDLFKMVAFQAESDLVRLVAPHYRRAEQEGHSLICVALANEALSKSSTTSSASPLR